MYTLDGSPNNSEKYQNPYFMEEEIEAHRAEVT